MLDHDPAQRAARPSGPPGALTPGSPEIDEFIRTNLRWNYFTISFDWVFFVFALSLVSSSTVMPAFAERLGASNLVIGAIPAAFTLGFFLPGIFSARHIEQQARKLGSVSV